MPRRHPRIEPDPTVARVCWPSGGEASKGAESTGAVREARSGGTEEVTGATDPEQTTGVSAFWLGLPSGRPFLFPFAGPFMPNGTGEPPASGLGVGQAAGEIVTIAYADDLVFGRRPS